MTAADMSVLALLRGMTTDDLVGLRADLWAKAGLRVEKIGDDYVDVAVNDGAAHLVALCNSALFGRIGEGVAHA